MSFPSFDANVEIPVDKCVPDLRNAKNPNELKEMSKDHPLVESMEKFGQIQPIVVYSLKDGRYQIINGNRRWRVYQLLGKKMIFANVFVKELTDEQKRTITWNEGMMTAENIPEKYKKNNNEYLTIDLDGNRKLNISSSEYERLERYAEKNNLTVQQAIEKLVEEILKKQSKKGENS